MKIAFNPESERALQSAPKNNDITFDLKGVAIYAKGVKFKGTDTTYSVFKKHSSSDNTGGHDGLVPVPSYNNNSSYRFLREDGKWEEPGTLIAYYPTMGQLTTTWLASGFILSPDKGFQTGVYVIKIMNGNLMFSGTASVVVGDITVEDEIMLHMSGMPQFFTDDGHPERIYAKIAPSESADYGEIYLATNIPQSAITNLSITMKKLI